MKRRLISLLLVLILCAGLPLSAAADAYIPPERIEGFDMNYAYMEDGNCKALNTFMSNFAEIALKEYTEGLSDAKLYAAVLKHLELNAGYYGGSVTKFTGEDGKTYMRVDGDFFEERMAYLFDRSVSAEDCPGYNDGYIEVSAAHFGGPIQVFANVYGCYPVDDDLYEVYFDVFRVDKDFSGWYTTAYANLPWDNLTSLGFGCAYVRYAGGKTNETILTSDFTLVELTLDAEGIPCQGANLPYEGVEQTQPPETQAPTEAPTEAETQAPTKPEKEEKVPDTQRETKPAREEKDDEPEKELEEEPDFADVDITLVLVIILVAAVVLLSLILIVALLTKKKKHT